MTKNLVSGQILAPFTKIWALKIFSGFYLYQILDIVACYYCMQFQGKLLNEQNLRKLQKTQFLGPISARLAQIRTAKTFFQKSGFVSHQISWSAIIMYNMTDGRTDTLMDRWTRVISYGNVQLTSSVQYKVLCHFFTKVIREAYKKSLP